jgi:hypothetical protein
METFGGRKTNLLGSKNWEREIFEGESVSMKFAA